MRYVSKLSRKRLSKRLSFNSLLQLWFNYHILFYRCLINRGLKLRAFNYFILIKRKIKILEDFDPSFIFILSFLKITPSLNIRYKKMGGALYGVPFPVNYWKRISLSCKWVINFLKTGNKKLSVDNIVEVIVSSLYEEGVAFSKKMEVYNSAVLNRHLLRKKIFKA